MTRLDRVAIVVVAALALGRLFLQAPSGPGEQATERRPLPAPPPQLAPLPAPPSEPPARVRRPLPQAAPNDPVVPVQGEEGKPGMVALGTSFPIADATWLTARHVANATCRKLALLVAGRATAARIDYLDPQSDLALLRTQAATAPALPLERGALSADETGFSFGFPGGNLGAARALLMGRSRMQLGGRLGGVGPALTWAEVDRFPDNLAALGGMSGGPMLDADGKVIGIMVAATPRRGRIITVAPEVLLAAVAAVSPDANAKQATAAGLGSDPVALGQTAAALSASDRIVKTYCFF